MAELTIIIDGILNDDYVYLPTLCNMQPHHFQNNTPLGFETDSLTCIMNILGVPKCDIPQGRAYLECLSTGIEIDKDDLFFRCNSIVINDANQLVSCTSFCKAKNLYSNALELVHLGLHKYILIAKGCRRFYSTCKTFPPHQNLEKNIFDLLPSAHEPLKTMLDELILREHIFPWGEAVSETFKSFSHISGKHGAVVAKTEIVVGIAKALDMFVYPLKNATGEVDTDLDEKASAAISLLDTYDFVLLHINGADESAHRKNPLEKLRFLKKIDTCILSPILENSLTGTVISILADHETSTATGAHLNSDVPYYKIIKE